MKQEENPLSASQRLLLSSSTELNSLLTDYAIRYVKKGSSQDKALYDLLRGFKSHLKVLTNCLVASERRRTSETIPVDGETISMSDKSGTTISIRIDNGGD